MVSFWRWFNCFNDSRPLSTTFEQSVTCSSFNEFLTYTNRSSASFSICLHRFNMIRSIDLHPLKWSKPRAMIDESDASTIFICEEFVAWSELYSLTGWKWFWNWTAPPFFIILSKTLNIDTKEKIKWIFKQFITYHSAHNLSGPTSSRRCSSTLLKATRKYPKKLRICRLMPLLKSDRSPRPKAEHNNFDVILICKHLIRLQVILCNVHTIVSTTVICVQLYYLLWFECHSKYGLIVHVFYTKSYSRRRDEEKTIRFLMENALIYFTIEKV